MRDDGPIGDKLPMAKQTAKKSAHGIELGSIVKDRITGFTGVAIARTEFGYGCVHVQIEASQLTKCGDPIPVQTFDDQRVDLVSRPTKSWPEPRKSAVKLGDWVRDTITGATGTATARTLSLDGRVKIMIEQPGLTDQGEPRAPLVFIADRIEVVDRRTLETSPTSVAKSGGPMARTPASID